jgi:hypothetical protein
MDTATRYYSQNLLAEQMIADRKGLCDYLKPRFLAYNFDPVKKSSKTIFITEISGWCKILSFYCDKEIEAKLREIGIDKKIGKSFVQMSAINEVLDRIASKGILVLKHEALKFIVEYIESKIDAAVANQLYHEKCGNKEVNKRHVQISNLFRTQEYNMGRGTESRDKFKNLMHRLINEGNKLNQNDFNFKTFSLNSAKGKVENYYIKQLIGCFLARQTSQDELFRNIYPLLRLIVKDRPEKKKLLSEEEFYAKIEIDPEYYIDKDYAGYMARTVQIFANLSTFS